MGSAGTRRFFTLTRRPLGQEPFKNRLLSFAKSAFITVRSPLVSRLNRETMSEVVGRILYVVEGRLDDFGAAGMGGAGIPTGPRAERREEPDAVRVYGPFAISPQIRDAEGPGFLYIEGASFGGHAGSLARDLVFPNGEEVAFAGPARSRIAQAIASG